VKVAYFSPLPPQQTGVATYSHHLLRALRHLVEPVLFTSDAAGADHEGLPVRDIRREPERVRDMHRCTGAIYHLGNNPFFHLDIYRTLLAEPGMVVMHDTVLYYLMAGQGCAGLLKELCINHGAAGANALGAVLRESPDGNPLRFPHPERHPLLRRALEHATAVVVHSDFAAGQLRDAGFHGRIQTIPHLRYPVVRDGGIAASSELRRRRNISPERLVIGLFGFVGRTKRAPAVLAALAALRHELDFSLLVVGESLGHVEHAIAEHGLGDRVVLTGYVPDEEFGECLDLIDVLVNLRYPSMGETSGTLTQAMARGKPCIVTDHAWFAELPDDAVWKVGHGPGEVADVVEALRALGASDELRRRLGEHARRYVETTCDPGLIAKQYVGVFVDAVREARRRASAVPPDAPSWPREYMLARARAAYPVPSRPIRSP
jgi:glycosyltransferase involved in cell wall biosynthesis